MSDNTTLLITLAQPASEEVERFQSYVGASTELAVAAGAEVGNRFAVRSVIGDVPAAVFGFASFPSAESITTMFDGDAYQALIPNPRPTKSNASRAMSGHRPSSHSRPTPRSATASASVP